MSLKVALVHDWFTAPGGAEKVVAEIIKIYPQCELFSIVDFLEPKHRDSLKGKLVNTSFIQKLPFAKTKYRTYLPLMPIAIEQFDLSKFDLIISSSSCVAKGVITGPDQLHICMCYSPMRYAWDLQFQYLKESNLNKGLKGIIAKYFLHKLRIWDQRTTNGVDHFISISHFIKKRINKVYGRDSEVIYPPVNTNEFKATRNSVEDYYVTSSRMVPYKKIDLIVDTFTKRFPNKKLIVIGDGPDFKKIKGVAGPNVELKGYLKFSEMKAYIQKSRAFIFAAEEDFGIAPLEAQAAGVPVIAYGKGGALETVVSFEINPTLATGIFFEEQNVCSLEKGILAFEQYENLIKTENCIKNAERFSELRFVSNMKNYINEKLTEKDR
jgi:glycosyltransferase involved in cell wall biosynthesis